MFVQKLMFPFVENTQLHEQQRDKLHRLNCEGLTSMQAVSQHTLVQVLQQRPPTLPISWDT